MEKIKKIWQSKGFSLVEVLIVLALLTAITGTSLLVYRSTQARTDLINQVESFVSNLRLAQSSAASGLAGGNHGLRIGESSYITFVGAAYVEGADSNLASNLPATITITNISLNGGGSDLVFSGPDGETANYGTVQFNSNSDARQFLVSVNAKGIVTYQQL